jgi:hypothetical protein
LRAAALHVPRQQWGAGFSPAAAPSELGDEMVS